MTQREQNIVHTAAEKAAVAAENSAIAAEKSTQAVNASVRIEAASEHAAIVSTKSARLLKWNNFATIITCVVGVIGLLAYFFSFAEDWRGVKDDINALRGNQVKMEKNQTDMKDLLDKRGKKIDDTHYEIERLIDHAGLQRSSSYNSD